ncbi:hypothetical protein H920_08765 [Fukomys damarensis]|uniref:Uncharacterized protein n=1 Tax=Fukomys damarensis TaxID=885580 RepID=A0A091DH88_FUKDA|nr:hypothetical protein H920_08765 [Fukomys damarensis]
MSGEGKEYKMVVIDKVKTGRPGLAQTQGKLRRGYDTESVCKSKYGGECFTCVIAFTFDYSFSHLRFFDLTSVAPTILSLSCCHGGSGPSSSLRVDAHLSDHASPISSAMSSARHPGRLHMAGDKCTY